VLLRSFKNMFVKHVSMDPGSQHASGAKVIALSTKWCVYLSKKLF